jgi:hypothetical protein
MLYQRSAPSSDGRRSVIMRTSFPPVLAVVIALLWFPISLVAQTTAPRPPLEFRGHHIGDSIWTKKNCFEHDSACSDHNHPIGDVTVFVFYNFSAGRLTEIFIHFPARDYETIVRAFIAKFGLPDTNVVVQLQNRMGAKFDNPQVIWRDDQTTLSISRYGKDLDNGIVTMLSNEQLRHQPIADDSAAQRAKRDL